MLQKNTAVPAVTPVSFTLSFERRLLGHIGEARPGWRGQQRHLRLRFFLIDARFEVVRKDVRGSRSGRNERRTQCRQSNSHH